VLALALGGRTVAEWQACMPQPEFLEWMAFYRLWPFDDFHRFHRPAAMVANAAAGGGDMTSRLEWLQPDVRAVDDSQMTDADRNTLSAFGIKTQGKAGQ
jgi:hypothetical protein